MCFVTDSHFLSYDFLNVYERVQAKESFRDFDFQNAYALLASESKEKIVRSLAK